jgi:hypothetical protein
MLTRSKKTIQKQLTNQTHEVFPVSTFQERPKNILEVNIDFDEAINAWRSNKKSIGNGHYKYICQVIVDKNKDKNKNCERVCYKGTNKCWNHRSK